MWTWLFHKKFDFLFCFDLLALLSWECCECSRKEVTFWFCCGKNVNFLKSILSVIKEVGYNNQYISCNQWTDSFNQKSFEEVLETYVKNLWRCSPRPTPSPRRSTNCKTTTTSFPPSSLLLVQIIHTKAFNIVSRWALNNPMYCHLKSYSCASSGTKLLPESQNPWQYPTSTIAV